MSAYLKALLDELGLNAWTIRVIWDEYPDRAAEGNILAEVEPTRGRYLATLKFGEDFWGLDRGETRSTLVHELLHLEHASVWFLIDNEVLKETLGALGYAMLCDSINRELERMVDHLASTIAPHVPLPPRWPAQP